MLSVSDFERPLQPTLNKVSLKLCLNTTLKDLPLWECQVEAHHLAKEVADKLQANPLLPGVIMTENGKFSGMISRRRFLEHISRPYGVDLFLKRPLYSLYRFARSDDLVFAGDTLVVDAAGISLARSRELYYEPIVVEIAANDMRLLELHELLIAHSQIHELARELLEKTRQKLETANEQLQRQASLDGLTGIANRRCFDQYLETEWRRQARQQNCLSLILCDVDFFKLYNDFYGHQAGDYCLQKVSNFIAHCSDRPGHLVARYGGEEFAIILPNTNATEAVIEAEKIRQGVRSLAIPHINSTVAKIITLSCGVSSLIPSLENPASTLIALADKGLYQAKASGRDCVILSSD